MMLEATCSEHCLKFQWLLCICIQIQEDWTPRCLYL